MNVPILYYITIYKYSTKAYDIHDMTVQLLPPETYLLTTINVHSRGGIIRAKGIQVIYKYIQSNPHITNNMERQLNVVQQPPTQKHHIRYSNAIYVKLINKCCVFVFIVVGIGTTHQ